MQLQLLHAAREDEHVRLRATIIYTSRRAHPGCRACRYAPESKFRFVEGTREELSLYQFGKKTVRHYFCPACGVAFLTAAFGHVVVNVRTVDGVDVTRLRIRHVDLANA